MWGIKIECGRIRPLLRNGMRPALGAAQHSAWAPRLQELAMAGFLPRALWRRLPASGSYRVRTHSSDYLFDSPIDDSFSRALFWAGLCGLEPETTIPFEREASHARVVVDVGANRGVYTLAALAANPQVKVIAIEASPTTFSHLQRVIAMNRWSSRVTLVNAAASDCNGSAAFHLPDLDLAPSARLVEASYRSPVHGSVIEVPTVRLDDLVDAADVVKLDVEGAEHLVLRGMKDLMLRCRPVIFIEALPEARNDACSAILAESGYRFFHLGPWGAIERKSLQPDQTRTHRNYVCRPSGPKRSPDSAEPGAGRVTPPPKMDPGATLPSPSPRSSS